jgi:Leucine-rich repeat (LRR) protein
MSKYCPNLKDQLEKFNLLIESLRNLLDKYLKEGDEEISNQIGEELKKARERFELFKKEYESKVIELLSQWYPKKENLNEFLSSIKINERGRIEIDTLDLIACNLTSFYLPKIFEKIRVLYCSDNKLTSLPTLPDGLEILDCSHNQLTSLPSPSARLRIIYCSGNRLPESELEKFRSNPNIIVG